MDAPAIPAALLRQSLVSDQSPLVIDVGKNALGPSTAARLLDAGVSARCLVGGMAWRTAGCWVRPK